MATVLSGFLLVQGCGIQAEETTVAAVAVPVKMQQIPMDQSSEAMSFVAEAIATKEAELAFQVPGEVQLFDIKMGDDVRKGQVLATLDPNDYQLAVEAKKAQFELATVRLNQAERLFQSQLISEDEYDQAKTSHTAAQSRLDEALTDLDHTRILAPFTGVASLTYINPYQYVAVKQPILKIIEHGRLNLTFSLPVHLAEKLKVETLKSSPLSVSLSRFKGIELPATFREISTQPDPDTNSYTVELTIKRPDSINILPGMSGLVTVKPQADTRLGIQIPDGAIYSMNGNRAQLWLVHPHSMTLHKVTVQLDENNYLISGLSPGDNFVSAGAKALTENQRVKPWERERGI